MVYNATRTCKLIYQLPHSAPANPAALAFQSMFSDLLTAIQSPTILAAELYSKLIIPSTLLDRMALTGLGDCEKNLLLLKAVGARLQTNPSDFETVVSVFEDSAALLPDYAIRLKEAYNKFSRL